MGGARADLGPATSKYVDTLLRYGKVCRGDDILYNTRHIDPTLREEEENEEMII